MKLAFATSVKLGLSCIEEIYRKGYELDLIITLKDDIARSKSGRVYLDRFCKDKSIELLKINHINDPSVRDEIISRSIDYLFIIGWSQVANIELIQSTNLGVLGIHPSLLPVGRGRASIPWTILKGLTLTGVTLFKLDQGIDTGPLLAQYKIYVDEKETATTLYKKVNESHVLLIRNYLDRLLKGTLKEIVQDEKKSTFWPGRKPKDGEIDLNSSVYYAERLVRAVSKPYPGAFYIKGTSKIIIWEAHISFKSPKEGMFLSFSDGYLIIDNAL